MIDILHLIGISVFILMFSSHKHIFGILSLIFIITSYYYYNNNNNRSLLSYYNDIIHNDNYNNNYNDNDMKKTTVINNNVRNISLLSINDKDIQKHFAKISKYLTKYNKEILLEYLTDQCNKIDTMINNISITFDENILLHDIKELDDIFNEIILNTPFKIHKKILLLFRLIMSYFNKKLKNNKYITNEKLQLTLMSM